jgi:outer membrane lipoprotein-sorting protein
MYSYILRTLERKNMKLLPLYCYLFLVWMMMLPSNARPGDGDEEKKMVIANVKASNEKIQSLTAKMKQRKISSFMEKEIVSKSDFYYKKPGHYVISPDKDDENKYIVTPKEIWIVNKKNKTITVTNDKEIDLSQYLMGIGEKEDILETLFDVRVETRQTAHKFGFYKMYLIPSKTSKLYEKLEKIILYIRDDLWLPYGAELYENDGDITIWEFNNIKINPKIKDDVFKQEMPKGYTLKKYEKKKES